MSWSIASLLMGGLIVAAVAYVMSPSPVHLSQIRFEVSVSGWSSLVPQLSVSPDGQWIALVEGSPGTSATLAVRSMKSSLIQKLTSIEGMGLNPFWSPDSRYIAFFSGEKLRKISITGGVPEDICRVETGLGHSGTWNQDGIILFSGAKGLNTVSAVGGESQTDRKSTCLN